MQFLTLGQVADFVGVAEIESTANLGGTISNVCNIGTTVSPCRYILTNEATSESVIRPTFFNESDTDIGIG